MEEKRHILVLDCGYETAGTITTRLTEEINRTEYHAAVERQLPNIPSVADVHNIMEKDKEFGPFHTVILTDMGELFKHIAEIENRDTATWHVVNLATSIQKNLGLDVVIYDDIPEALSVKLRDAGVTAIYPRASGNQQAVLNRAMNGPEDQTPSLPRR